MSRRIVASYESGDEPRLFDRYYVTGLNRATKTQHLEQTPADTEDDAAAFLRARGWKCEAPR